ncbi:hypothetical protein ACJRO7_004544 [Eucalyptus globulus]|uniref:Uncharacterized protein n=1 Tax=Eucalyptus globulus TaxID=34317 RepID=A0ABD3J2V4_EUCGL
MATSGPEHENRIVKLKTSINRVRFYLAQTSALHFASLVFILGSLTSSNFGCTDAWMPVALVLLATTLFSFIYVRQVLRLVDLHVKLNAAKLGASWDEEDGAWMRTHWNGYAILAVVCSLFCASVMSVIWVMLTCQHA